MKVLMTADCVGGVWAYALELAGALEAHGVEVVLATQGAPLRPAQRRAAGALGNVTLEESAYRLEWMDAPWPDIRRGDAWLLELEAKHAPDVVHLNDLTRGALPWQARALVVGHSCVGSWWSAVRREPLPGTYDEYRRRVTASLQAAELVVAPSAAMLGALRLRYGPFRRAQVVYNGRDPGSFPPGVREPFIFGAGRVWDEGKNLGALGRVASALRWPVFIAGDARHPDGGAAACGGARLLGALGQPALARWYGAASIYALPARYEPFGLSALEAALAGCALVLGDVPTLREVWGDAAVYVDPFDDDALADALRRLIGDEGVRRSYSEASRTQALSYSTRRMAGEYRSIYRALAAMAPGRREEATACA
jgi:glycogen synthase